MSVLLNAALTYAKAGWPVHPLRFDTGTPWLGRDRDGQGREVPNTGGVRKASTDPDLVRSWWRKWPNARIAAAAGSPIGAFVLDVDVKGVDGREVLALLEEQHGRLPETWESVTPSGGLHLYFAMPQRELRNRVGFAAGLDIRTTGGSITLPPSEKPQGAYLWTRRPWEASLAQAPPWLLDLAAPPPPPPRPFKPLSVRSGDRYGTAAINRECGELAAMGPNSGRNQRLFIAAARLGELVAGGVADEAAVERALEDAADACGLLREDGILAIRGTIANGLRRGATKPRGAPSAVSPQLRAAMARRPQ